MADEIEVKKGWLKRGDDIIAPLTTIDCIMDSNGERTLDRAISEKANSAVRDNYASAIDEYVEGTVKAEISDFVNTEIIPNLSTALGGEIEDLKTNKADKSDTYTKTEVNELIPDTSNFLTEHQSLDGYAKSEDIPVNISQLNNDAGYVLSTTIPTTEVAGPIKSGNWLQVDPETQKLKCGELTLQQYNSATGYTFISKTTLSNVLTNKIPTKVSQLTNDSKYVLESTVPTTTKPGPICSGNWLQVDPDTHKLKCGELTKEQYDSATGYTFISKTTLENVLSSIELRLRSLETGVPLAELMSELGDDEEQVENP